MCMYLCLCVCGQRGRKEDEDVDDGDDEDNKEQDYKQGDRIGPQCHYEKSFPSDSCVSSPEVYEVHERPHVSPIRDMKQL